MTEENLKKECHDNSNFLFLTLEQAIVIRDNINESIQNSRFFELALKERTDYFCIIYPKSQKEIKND